MTVQNPTYPITTDILYTICKQFGQVARIVVFHKHGVQALVEFAVPEEAVRAKEALDGREIYDNCCKLKIEYSRSQTLNGTPHCGCLAGTSHVCICGCVY